AVNVSVADARPVAGAAVPPFRYCHDRNAVSVAPAAYNATQSAAFPGPFVTATVARAPADTCTGAGGAMPLTLTTDGEAVTDSVVLVDRRVYCPLKSRNS